MKLVAPFIELTTEQAGRLVGISGQAMRRRCEKGLIDAYRTDGKKGQWRVKVRPDEVVSKEEAQALQKENSELKAKLDAVLRILESD